MSGKESNAVPHFSDELDRLVNRFRDEYDMSYAEAVGCLLMRAHTLMQEAADRVDEVE